MTDPVVVTGLGFVSPLGTGPEEVWSRWSRGSSGVRHLESGDPRLVRGVDPIALPPVGKAGFVRGFDPKQHVRSPHLRRMDWCSRMIVASATQAVADARVDLDDEENQIRTGLVVGSCFGNQRETQKYMDRVFERGPAAGQPILFPNLVLNASAGYAAIELSIRGPNVSVSEHEASGEVAIATALDLLDGGLCDRVVVAGGDEFGSVYLDALRERRLLAAETAPDRAREDACRGRLIPGEGAAALVLDRASRARARGRAAYAAVSRVGLGSIGCSPYLAPDPERAARELVRMVENAPDRPISAVFGGASGTEPRDALDRAFLESLGRHQGSPPDYLRFDDLVGDWPSRGILIAALAALALRERHAPGLERSAIERIVVPGSGRGGVLVPVVLDMLA